MTMVPRRSTRLAAVPSQPRPSRRSRRLAGKAAAKPRKKEKTTKQKQPHRHNQGTLESRPRNNLINRHQGKHENTNVPRRRQSLVGRDGPDQVTTACVPKELGNKNDQKLHNEESDTGTSPESKHGSPNASPVVPGVFLTPRASGSSSSNTSPEGEHGYSKSSPGSSEIFHTPSSHGSSTRRGNTWWINEESPKKRPNDHTLEEVGGVKRETTLQVIVGGKQYETDFNSIARQSLVEKKEELLVTTSLQEEFVQDNDPQLDRKKSCFTKTEHSDKNDEQSTIVDEEEDNDDGYIISLIRLPDAVRILNKGKQIVKRFVESIGYKYPSAATRN